MIRYCIVGSGFSGTCMLWHLVNMLCQDVSQARRKLSHIEISIIESRVTSGPGLPYNMNDILPYHRCNNPAEKMALFDNDFVDWMIKERDFIINNYSHLIADTHPEMDLSNWQPNAKGYYPRALFGVYLSMRFQNAISIARSNSITIREYTEYEAINGITDNAKFNLTIRCLKSDKRIILTKLDKVLLATGHWHSDKLAVTNVLASPYPTHHIYKNINFYQKINKKDQLTCYVQGMGPSAIDAILSLCEYGDFIYDLNGMAVDYKSNWMKFNASSLKIIAVSRSGFFPAVRYGMIEHEFKYLTEANIEEIKQQNKGFIKLDSLIKLIDLELKLASNNKLCFNDILTPKFKNAQEKLLNDIEGQVLEKISFTVILHARRLKFYQYLNPADKKIYDSKLDTHFIRVAVPIPYDNARKLIVLMQKGILTTVQLGYNYKTSKHFEIVYKDEVIKPDIVIKSNGSKCTINNHPSTLIGNLIKNQEIVEHKEDGYLTGGISVCENRSYQVINRLNDNIGYSANLYSFGPIIRYWPTQNNYASAFVDAAKLVSKDWVESIIKDEYNGS